MPFLFLRWPSAPTPGGDARLVALAFAFGYSLLLHLLPIGLTGDLCSISQPYLMAAALTVLWLYRPHSLFRWSTTTPALNHFGWQQGRLVWARIMR